MTSIILKAEYEGEIRRVGFNLDEDGAKITLAKLEAKLSQLFAHLPQPFHISTPTCELRNDADVVLAFAEAAIKKPPLVRLRVTAPVAGGEVVDTTCQIDYTQIPSPAESAGKLPDWATLSHPEISHARKCRLCKTTLEEVHFKCLNCLDCEICPRCEEAQLHDASHLLVKMRCPVECLPLKRQLIFKSHIDDPTERLMAREEKKRLQAKKAEHVNAKKEARDADRKKRAQDKLKRIQARKEKTSNKKAKLSSAEKKKATATSKVKRAKKVMALPVATTAVIEQEPVVGAEQSEPVVVAEPATDVPNEVSSSFIEIQDQEQPKEEEKSDFSLLRLLSEFQILKFTDTNVEQDFKEEPSEEKVEIELQEIREPEEAPEEEQPPAQVEAENEENHFAKNLRILSEMGFTHREKNIELLVRNMGNLDETINQLLSPQPFAAIARWLSFPLSL